MKRTHLRLAGIVAAGILAVSACSDSGDDAATDATAAAGSEDTGSGDTETGDTEGSADTAESGESDEGSDDTATAGDDTPATDAPVVTDVVPFEGDFCTAAADLVRQVSGLGSESGSTDVVAGLAEAMTGLETVMSSIGSLGAAAPEELQDDFAVIAEGFAPMVAALPDLSAFAQELEAAGDDPNALQEIFARYQETLAELQTADLESAELDMASSNIQEYVIGTCGIDLSE